MLSIQNNMLAMAASNHLQITSGKNRKTTEKLSSGYRINRAADDAAGLAISEKMRRQIRGLMQGTANAQDGVSFVQVADGSMDEVHSMLQRMNELAIQSLNGTWTESDRAAMNAEFDQLRTEIDRINNETQYNEQPVFEEHESSYHQISGNKKWDDNQLHTVPALNNELNIHLADYYEPKDYTLTVPAGVYTTQELIDEIDSALELMTPPNPGFVFEYTSDGICRLNFENANGMPTEIASVDGSLSYLLFDSYTGSSSTSLLGTTVFDARYPLTITRGQNDQLGFYVENANGSNFISVTIPPGQYSRSAMIDLINQNLAGSPDALGVAAKEYGSSSIQITGGDSVSITGLKGNMFKLETSSVIYSSVFYDNVKYGNSSGVAASVTGRTYYGASATDKICLSGGNQNNVLRFKLNGAADYTEITFADKADGYTMTEIRDEINNQLKDKGLEEAARASVTTTSVSVPSSPTQNRYPSVQYLTLSSLVKGSNSSLEFDTTDPVAVNTYNALFRDTNYLPYYFSGSKAKLAGQANLNGAVKLADDASLTFKVNDQNYTINNIGGSYTSCSALADSLNSYIKTDSAFDAVKDKIKFTASSGHLSIDALTDDVRKISFDDGQKNDTYKQLFVGTAMETNSASFSYSYGTVRRPQGSTIVETTNATATVSIPADKQNGDIKFTDKTNKITFSSSGGSGSISLSATKTYKGMADVVSDINRQLKSNSRFSSITASYKDNKLILTATPSTGNPNGSYYIEFDRSCSAWQAIQGTHAVTSDAVVTEASQYLLSTYSAIPDTTKVDSSNNELTLTIGQASAAITINPSTGAGYNRNQLKDAVQAAINNNAVLKDKVTVNIAADGKLEFLSSGGSITASGSFYKNVIITQKTVNESVQPGSYPDSSFQNAYIIGRKDLKAEPIDILSGANDTFIFDFSYTDPKGANSYDKEMEITIPEGTYTGDEVAAVLQEKIQEKFDEEQIEDFDIKVSIGGYKTNVIGANDDTALQIVVNRKAGKEPAEGQYVLDGIRGSAASFLFYKTTNKPQATYITGSRDLSGGVLFRPGQNVLTLSADSVPYQYTFPENQKYSPDEFITLLNDMFKNGDDNGNSAPLTASLENGTLKIAHKVLGSHTITDIGGSARSALFLNESGRYFRDPIYLLVGAETKDVVEIPRTRVSSCSLAINSITISKPKYAEKAVNRIKNAITMVSSRRSTYGSLQNRLEHTINNNNNVIENTQASESAIRDADVAFEVMEEARNNFLMQASATILAQANQQPNMVLNLLQT
ncbi:MAG: hypothetical protein NC312_05760 [Bacteroides fragilis]|nr:hypothetical protein [Bacteroides fragilis]